MKKNKFIAYGTIFILLIFTTETFIRSNQNNINYRIDSSSQNSSGLESCATISIHIGNKTMYAVNEARLNLDPVIAITEEGLVIGLMDDNGLNVGTLGVVNNFGLFGDENSLPNIPMNYNPTWDNVTGDEFGEILLISTNVSEFIDNMSNKNIFLWGEDSFGGQVHMADINGDGVIVGGNYDGDVVFTQKDNSSNYLLSMNYNFAEPLNTYIDFPFVSYDTATAMLDEIVTEEDLTIEAIVDVLDAIHVEGDQYETVFSYIVDPISKEIYCYYSHDFDVVFHWSYNIELGAGEFILYNIAQLYEEHQNSVMLNVFIMIATIGIPSMILIRFVVIKIRNNHVSRSKNKTYNLKEERK